MQKKHKKIIILFIIFLILAGLFTVFFTFFFDHAVLIRQDTFYRARVSEKVVAITFDDGPSPIWTPPILDALKDSQVKATFFMLGKHVEQYPAIARRVAEEGHDIGIHSYHHGNFIFYDKYEVEEDIKSTRKIIEGVTGQSTNLFRPPKAWLSKREKKKIKELGYIVALWSLNSKDWVNFDDKYMIRYLVKNIHPGAIILFHDSGGFFKAEEGNRIETVNTIRRLVEKLREKGYRLVTVSQLLEMEKAYENRQ
ncbi:MAG: polysaccharide deacetylase family protein [Candidatus Omnitrophica bacterium]|nr:polysaccharide deacetylase family protein [Candidatus Omnitrophota bacterium]MBL7150973.1 polysaccharide deacetylase family protein [Candidatus Omnitrophota bacterium]MBL7210160.1 polysaccharide deacetylase family protein [Candidatus Omnitrophota bacterium]